ncbi:phospholipid-transporting ATPase ABCA7 [Heliangelus exortis]|uniref:phospholipid-transporting ATPase ABCA7 n=1 Tax=Heliangelus exortis TaxID=472823 RepID=UPI003A94E6C2
MGSPNRPRVPAVVTQLGLLLWKNFTYRWRRRSQLAIEILWPLFLFLILISVRRSRPPFKQNQCHFLNKALPSAGLVPWLQGFVCNMRNPCFPHPTVGETPGLVNNFNSSLLSNLLTETHDFLHKNDGLQLLQSFNHAQPILIQLWEGSGDVARVPLDLHMPKREKVLKFLENRVSLPRTLAEILLKSSVNLRILEMRGPALKSLFCNISDMMRGGDQRLRDDIQANLCNLSYRQLNAMVHIFLTETNIPGLLADRMNSKENLMKPLARFLQNSAFMLKEILSMYSKFEREKYAWALRSPGASTLDALQLITCGRAGGTGPHIPSLNWYQYSDIKAFLKSSSRRQGPRNRDEASSPFCRELFQKLESSPFSSIIWQAVKPMIFGKILYTPPGPGPDSIMAEVNRTFQRLMALEEVGDNWKSLGPSTFSFFSNSLEMKILRNLLLSPRTAQLLSKFFSSSVNLPALARFLGVPAKASGITWKEVFTDVDAILSTLPQFLRCARLNKIEAVATEKQLVARAMELLEMQQFWAAVVFQPPINATAPKLPPHVHYKIRMTIDNVMRTDEIRDRFWKPSPSADPFGDMRYVWGGFAYLQDLVEQAVVRVQTGTRPQIGLYLQQMPHPCYVDDMFLRRLSRSLPLFMTLAWIYSVAMIIKGVVHEKETRVKETMKTMGLSNGILWLSWFLSSFILFLLSSAFLVFILKVGNILPYSNPATIYLFINTFLVATISQCFLISTFFFCSNLAAACGGIIYFSLYLPYVLCAAWQDYVTFPVRILVSLMSPVAFSFGCQYFSLYEDQGVGSQWHNMGSSPLPGDRYSPATAMGLLLLDAALYGLATWYIEGIFPGQYGIPKPWNFPFLKSYWFGEPDEKPPLHTTPLTAPRALVEKPPAHLQPSVSIRNLVKVYPGSSHVTVNSLSLDFYEGQITSFLGHNGAGKTTTISILTGLLPPTSGTAHILGRDIRSEMESIRKTMGVCPQHNVLFDILTVEEHVWFYGRLKGLSEEQVKAEMKQLIQDTGLLHKCREPTKNLSAGMQRRLSVAIAFVGGSRVIILDEPTAGVDPYSRRRIWELLLKYRRGRTIILSTHYMDEAELLGNRTAIISQGRLCCCGTPLFLKAKLGTGYHLTLVMRKPGRMGDGTRTTRKDWVNLDKSRNLEPDMVASTPGVAQVLALIQELVPGSRLVEDIGHELLFILPYSGARDGAFVRLFRKLEAGKDPLGISTYSISDTTLEEVFLKVTQNTELGAGTADTKREAAAPSKERDVEAEEIKLVKEPPAPAPRGDWGLQQPWGRVKGGALHWQQLRALFIKRMLHARRSTRGFFAQIILPVVFVCFALLFSLITPPFQKYPPLLLQPGMYGKQFTFFSNDLLGNNDMEQLLAALLDEPGFGTMCMRDAEMGKRPCPPASHPNGFVVPSVPPALLAALQIDRWTPANPSPSCRCSEPWTQWVLPNCPEGAGGFPPPQVERGTGDILLNLTGRNISDYLVKTYPQIIREERKEKTSVSEQRYGGFSLGSRSSQDILVQEDIDKMVLEIRDIFNITPGSHSEKLLLNFSHFVQNSAAKNTVKVWFNNKGWHSMVSFINVAHNGLLRGWLPPGTDPTLYGITVTSHPLDLNKKQLSEHSLLPTRVDVLVSICVMFAMSFIPASFVLFLIEERVSKAKHLQFVSGMKPITYWLGNFAWDMCNYLVPALLVILIFLCFQQQSYVSSANLPALVLLLLLYGWSITPLMYPASFFFSTPSTAYVALACINLFIGINSSIATYMLDLSLDHKLHDINRILKNLFLIFPHFCLARGLMDMARNQAMADAFKRFGNKGFVSPLSWNLAGANMFAMAIEGIIFFLFTLLLQYRFSLQHKSQTRRLPRLQREDRDVARERARVQSMAPQSSLLLLKDLTKVYRHRNVPAVERLCLAIPPGECFGLLGVNGAGKTSTFRMLTGDTGVTLGCAWLKGYSVLTNLQLVRQHVGYCPQFNAITELLTGRENLEFYSRLRGIPEQDTPKVVQWGLTKLGLELQADQPVGKYSRGNKRKLSTAIALLSSPPIVFLDEPTTGVDPHARRFLWDCILSVIRDGRSVVLTSHSMEECEALCTRMAIMVNGRFRCLGSIQHLKTRFGDGYTMLVRVGLPQALRVHRLLRSLFPGIALKEQHGEVLHYHLPSRVTSLARVFSVLSDCRSRYDIEDFSVSQTTLDQVFLRFAREQTEEEPQGVSVPEDKSPGMLRRWRRWIPFLKDNTSRNVII